MMPHIYIIILNRNGYKDTIECLESLKNNTYDLIDIVLVDNFSTNDSLSRINDFLSWCDQSFQNKVSIIQNDQNYWFAEWNNIAIKKILDDSTISDGDIICLLNNDTTVDNKYFEECIKKYQTIGGKVWFRWARIKKYGTEHDQIKKFSKYQEISPVDWLSGACLFGTKKVFQDVGMFDITYYLYYEDTDLCHRALKYWYQNRYIPTESSVYHKINASSNKIKYKAIYYKIRNAVLFRRRNWRKKSPTLIWKRILVVLSQNRDYLLTLNLFKIIFFIGKWISHGILLAIKNPQVSFFSTTNE